MALTSAARPLGVQDEDANPKLTEEEEREAIAVGERFVRRLQETGDVAPLLRELFVADYAERLRRQESSVRPHLLLGKSVAAQASEEELKRYYIALNNAGYLGGLLSASYEASQTKDEVDGKEHEPKLEELLPPDIMLLFKNDPILASLTEEQGSERIQSEEEPTRPNEMTGETAPEKESGNAPIQTLEQLRNFTSTLEEAARLSRKHLAALPTRLNWLDRHEGADEEENWEKEREWMSPRAWVLREDFYGYPEGTRIICMKVLCFHMDVVRVEGELKILALYFNMD